MDTQRTGRQPGDKLSVIVVDENLWHANTARHMLAKHGFQGKYTVLIYLCSQCIWLLSQCGSTLLKFPISRLAMLN